MISGPGGNVSRSAMMAIATVSTLLRIPGQLMGSLVTIQRTLAMTVCMVMIPSVVLMAWVTFPKTAVLVVAWCGSYRYL